jgi:cob(I)alamin adenosyltransferase
MIAVLDKAKYMENVYLNFQNQLSGVFFFIVIWLNNEVNKYCCYIYPVE